MLRLRPATLEIPDRCIAKIEHIADIEFKDYGDPEGRAFEALLIAVRAYLAQRRSQ